MDPATMPHSDDASLNNRRRDRVSEFFTSLKHGLVTALLKIFLFIISLNHTPGVDVKTTTRSAATILRRRYLFLLHKKLEYIRDDPKWEATTRWTDLGTTEPGASWQDAHKEWHKEIAPLLKEYDEVLSACSRDLKLDRASIRAVLEEITPVSHRREVRVGAAFSLGTGMDISIGRSYVSEWTETDDHALAREFWKNFPSEFQAFTVKALASIAGSVLILLPVIVIFFIQSTGWRIFTLCFFVLLYGILFSFTNASIPAILAALAGFAAVLVVFINTPSS